MGGIHIKPIISKSKLFLHSSTKFFRFFTAIPFFWSSSPIFTWIKILGLKLTLVWKCDIKDFESLDFNDFENYAII